MVWVFTGVLGVFKVVVGARCVLGVHAVTLPDCCGDTVMLSVEERTRDSQGLSALESSGGLANGGVCEMTSMSTGWVQCSRNH